MWCIGPPGSWLLAVGFVVVGGPNMSDRRVDDAVDIYLKNKSQRVSDSTLRNNTDQLHRFLEWCESEDLEWIADIEPVDIARFRRHRAEHINSNTMYNQLSVLRMFLEFCERMGWVESNLSESIILPDREGRARDREISSDRVQLILDDLGKYEYGSVDHVVVGLLWVCSFRIGTIRSLDLPDLQLADDWIDINQRPGTGTPLKNGSDSEREVAIPGWLSECLDSYISDIRRVSDDSDRQPVVVSRQSNRLARSSIRRIVYTLTDCGGVLEDCSCDCRSSKCSESVSPHDIRRASISAMLSEGNNTQLVGDRVDCSADVIEEHYDNRSEAEKRQLRANELGI